MLSLVTVRFGKFPQPSCSGQAVIRWAKTLCCSCSNLALNETLKPIYGRTKIWKARCWQPRSGHSRVFWLHKGVINLQGILSGHTTRLWQFLEYCLEVRHHEVLPLTMKAWLEPQQSSLIAQMQGVISSWTRWVRTQPKYGQFCGLQSSHYPR